MTITPTRIPIHNILSNNEQLVMNKATTSSSGGGGIGNNNNSMQGEEKGVENHDDYDRMPVPEQELKAVIEAIHNAASRYKQQTTIDNNNDDDNATQSEKDKLINELQTSLIHHVNAIVQPIPWEEYERQFILFDTPKRQRMEKSTHHNNGDDNNDGCSSSSCSSDSEEEEEELQLQKTERASVNTNNTEPEMEEEELLDQTAIKRVKQLRHQIRQVANRTCQIRSIHIQRLGMVLQREMILWKSLPKPLQLQQLLPNDDDDNTNEYNKNEEELVKEDKEKNDKGIHAMKSALVTLSTTLQKLDVELPEQLELLSDTLSTVESAQMKRKREEEGTEMMMRNGTERAILSRVEPIQKHKKQIHDGHDNSGGESIEKDVVELDPEQRFALFMSNHC